MLPCRRRGLPAARNDRAAGVERLDGGTSDAGKFSAKATSQVVQGALERGGMSAPAAKPHTPPATVHPNMLHKSPNVKLRSVAPKVGLRLITGKGAGALPVPIALK